MPPWPDRTLHPPQLFTYGLGDDASSWEVKSFLLESYVSAALCCAMLCCAALCCAVACAIQCSCCPLSRHKCLQTVDLGEWFDSFSNPIAHQQQRWPVNLIVSCSSFLLCPCRLWTWASGLTPSPTSSQRAETPCPWPRLTPTPAAAIRMRTAGPPMYTRG